MFDYIPFLNILETDHPLSESPIINILFHTITRDPERISPSPRLTIHCVEFLGPIVEAPYYRW